MKSIFLLLLGSLIACNPYPKDTKNSYQEAKQNGLKVGVAINPPFTQFKNDSFSGSEIKIIRDFAASENLEIEFIRDSESDLIKEIENHRLHLVAGGFKKGTIWKKKTKPTVPYDKKHIFLTPPGENHLLFKLEEFIFNHKRK